MRLSWKVCAAILGMAILASGGVFAQGETTERGASGNVVSVDKEAKTFVIKEKDENDLTVKMHDKFMFLTTVGTLEDLADGRPVEVNGKVSEAKDGIEATTIVLYTDYGRGGNRLGGDKRVDGTLVKKGEGWAVTYADGEMAVTLGEKSQVQRRAPATADNIAPGVRISTYGKVQDNVLAPNFICIYPPKAE